MALPTRLLTAALAATTAVTLVACSAPRTTPDDAPSTSSPGTAADDDGRPAGPGGDDGADEDAGSGGTEAADGSGDDGGGSGGADGDAPASGQGADGGGGDPVALPEVAVPAGTEATNGTITVTIPDSFTAGGTFDGVQVFDGPGIEEIPTGVSPSVQLYPVGEWDWDGAFPEPYRPDATATEYVLDVPGADRAAMQFTSAPGTFVYEFDDGETQEEGPMGRAQIYVSAGGRISSITIVTGPGQEGLDLAASIAGTITLS